MIANSVICSGNARILNKLYCKDLSVSNSVTFSALTVTGNATIGGTLGVTGNTTLTTMTATGTAVFSKVQDLSGTANNSPALIIGGTATSTHMEIDDNEIQAKNNGTTVRELFINNDGGKVNIGISGKTNVSTTGTLNTDVFIVDESASITYLTSPKIVADNVHVLDLLRATRYEIDTISAVGGSLYVAPTIIFSSNAQVAITAISGTTVTAAFIDSTAINGDSIGGVQWSNYSKIKVSGRLGDVILGNNGGTCSGSLTAKMNNTAGRINCTFECDQASSLEIKTYAASEVHDLRVMIYEKGVNSTTSYPVGILLTGYGTNNNSYIDMYQGEDSRTKPRVRLGKLDGLDSSITVGGVAPTGWGLYADNVFLKGTIHSTAGVIGEWTMSNGKMYYSANTPGSNSCILAPGGVTSTTSIAGSGSTSRNWAFTIKTAFGVTTDGALYSKSGKIGGWTIGDTSLTNGTWGTSGSAMMCTGTSDAKQIGGSASISGWTFSSGANFGVTSTGALYCSDAHVSGEITATSGSIGGCSIQSGSLKVDSAHITSVDASTITSGYISADRIQAGTITADMLSASAIVVGGRNILHGSDSLKVGSGGWATGYYENSASTLNTSLFNIEIDNAPVAGIKKGIRLKATSSQTAPGYGQGAYPMYGHIGDVLTYSVWVKGSKANQTVRLQAFSCGVSGESETNYKDFTITTANKWTRFSYTTAAIQYDHASITIGYVYMRNTTTDDTLEVCAPMLEWGTRASDWTPSPDEVGGFAIDASSIHTYNVAVTSNADNSIALSSVDFTRTINGTSRSGLRFALGDNFAVTGDGALYASAGEIGGCSISSGVLYVKDANISGKISANHIDASGITIGLSQVTDLDTTLDKFSAVNGTCSTDASEQVKVVNCSGFQLYNGALIIVSFNNANTYVGQIKLNINNTGEKVVNTGSDTSSTNNLLWASNAVIQFRYNGTKFIIIDQPKTWYGITACSTAASTAAKVVSTGFTNIVVCRGTKISLYMNNKNTATSPTLNIMSLGAKNIYAGNGTTAPLESNGLSWASGSTVEFIFDGQYWRVGDTASLLNAFAAGKTATNFITTIDNGGIKVHDADNSTDYIHITSDGSDIYKASTKVASFGTDITLGQTGTDMRNIFIDSDSGVSIRKSTTVLANYGDTITINHGTSGKKALTIDSTNGVKFYELDGTTQAAQLNASGLVVSAGIIGGCSIINGALQVPTSVVIGPYGGRNLMINTLIPDVSSTSNYPKLKDCTVDTAISNGTKTVAEHGFRITSTGNVRMSISFGGTTSGMMGLESGKSYTFSCDATWKLLTGFSSNSNTYALSGYLYTKPSAASSYTYTRTGFYDITQDLRGVEMSGRIEWTFTVPQDIDGVYLQITTNNTSGSAYPSGDFIELRNIMFEEGFQASTYVPAIEDTSVQSIYTTGTTTIDGGKITTGSIDADQISASAVIVGGRNILRGTEFMKLLASGSSWASGNFYPSGATINTSVFTIDITDSPVPNIKKGIQLKATSSQTAPGFAQAAFPMSGHVGDKLTFSVWVKGSKANQRVRLQAYYTSASGVAESSAKDFTIVTPNKWTRISYTTPAIKYDHASGISVGYVYLRETAVDDTLDVCGQMLEWGNRVSDWTPSPDEVAGFAAEAGAIHTANVAITSNADNSVALSSVNFTRTVCGSSRTDLRFAIGSNFGISNTGAMYASSGDIGGIHVTSSSIYSGSKSSTSSNNAGFYLDSDGKFELGKNNGNYLKWDGSNLSLNVQSLSIGGTSAATTSDVTSAATTAANNAVASNDIIIYGTQTGITGSWTGTTDKISSLVDGQRITYWLPYAGSGNATLNLTLAGGTTTGAKNVYYNGTSRLTTHYGAGNFIRLIYRVDAKFYTGTNGATENTLTGWWADANYDSNTYDRTRYNVAVKAAVAIAKSNIIVGNSSGYHQLNAGTAFDVSYPILYAVDAIAVNATGTNNYITIPFTVTTTQSLTLTAHKAVYIKGSLSGSTFTPVSATPLTQTIPSSRDGYYYIYLGRAYDTTSIWLENEHPVYIYENGFQKLDKIANNYMYYDSDGLVISTTGGKCSTGSAYNTQITSTGINLRCGSSKLSSWTSSELAFYKLGSDTKLMTLSNSSLAFYNTSGTKCAELTANGLEVSGGKIGGGWTIGTNCIYNGTSSMSSTTAGIYLGTDGIRNYNSAASYVNISSGKITAKGADISGSITSSDGNIGGWTLSSDGFSRTFTYNNDSYSIFLGYKNYTLMSIKKGDSSRFYISGNGYIESHTGAPTSAGYGLNMIMYRDRTSSYSEFGPGYMHIVSYGLNTSWQPSDSGNYDTSSKIHLYFNYSDALEVYSSTYVLSTIGAGNVSIQSANGNLTTITGGTISYSVSCSKSSDERKKTILNDLSNTELFMSIKPIQFRYKETPESIHYGVGAQTLKASLDKLNVENSIVYYDEKNDLYSVDYTELQMLTIPVVQDHEYRIRQLEKENAELREKLQKLLK